MKWIRKTILFLAILILLGSSFKIVSYLNESRKNKSIYTSIKKDYYRSVGKAKTKSLKESKNKDHIEDSSPGENPEKKLKDINQDIIAWLRVPGTGIDYPVVKENDNEFYLTHDINREPSIHGSIFMDYRNTMEGDKNLVIYGHYMRDGTMFRDLINYKDKDFFDKNRTITVDMDGEKNEYEIFSVLLTKGDSGYIDIDFDSEENFLAYVETINKKSLFQRNLDFSGDEEIITLSTCSYEFDNARTVIYGVKK